MLSAGSLVHERYRIVRQIGRGGMGTVYEAVDSRLKCTVALKQMLVLSDAGSALDGAFQHEAQLLAALRHPALPVVTDYFVEAGEQFLLMQFIPGLDLASALERRGNSFPFQEIRMWLERLFDALEYLHGHDPPIIHRDIKPANLKLTDDGELVLLDFGLAKGSIGSPAVLTTQASVAGFTWRYAPLEQMEGKGTDPRSDLYAVGATIYHLLTGIAPRSAMERATALVGRQPDPLRAAHVVAPSVPQTVSIALTKALALYRDDRFRSAREMRAALLATDGVSQSSSQLGPQNRRIDAAVPSQAEVGTPIDLFVQVRFPVSPQLGVEEWPERRRPAAVEQVSEALGIIFPRDSVSGALLPARLQVRIVAPNVRIDGQSQQTIDVPPDAYSQRIAFLLTATKPGLCRINVEVYGQDAVYLGAIPVQTEVCGESVPQARTAVANLLFEVLAQRMPELIAAAAGDAVTVAAQIPSPRVGAISTAPHQSTSTRPEANDGGATMPAPPPEVGPASEQSMMVPPHSGVHRRSPPWISGAAIGVLALAGAWMLRDRFGGTITPAFDQPKIVAKTDVAPKSDVIPRVAPTALMRPAERVPLAEPTRLAALPPRVEPKPVARVGGEVKREIESWIAAYRDAYQERNVDRLVALGVLKPENRSKLAAALDDLKDLKVTIASSSIDVAGPDSAVVTLTREDSFIAGDRTHSQQVSIKKNLRKVNGNWVAQ